jgi:hypothetical protein
MMLKLLSLLPLILPQVSRSPRAGPEIVVSPNPIDLGIVAAGQVVPVEVMLTNQSDHAVRIARLGSCYRFGTPDGLENYTLEAGASVTASSAFRVEPYWTDVNTEFYVVLDDGRAYEFPLTYSVVSSFALDAPRLTQLGVQAYFPRGTDVQTFTLEPLVAGTRVEGFSYFGANTVPWFAIGIHNNTVTITVDRSQVQPSEIFSGSLATTTVYMLTNDPANQWFGCEITVDVPLRDLLPICDFCYQGDCVQCVPCPSALCKENGCGWCIGDCTPCQACLSPGYGVVCRGSCDNRCQGGSCFSNCNEHLCMCVYH